MSKYLVSTVETYRVDTAEEAQKLINEAKSSNMYELPKYACEEKIRKSKSEIVDQYFKVSLTKVFCDINEHDRHIKATYSPDGENYGN